ncbi:MAG: tripartite tricarboxylate transporter substrate binding protein [Burkholderiales bacterium]
MVRLVSWLFGAMLCVLTAPVFGQSPANRTFPLKGIRVIIPYPAGGGNDTFGRLLVNGLNEGLAPGSIAENRGGAGAIVGTEIAARGNPDGHTLLIVSVPFVVMNGLYSYVKIDPIRDFTSVIHAGSAPSLLVVHPSAPYRTVRDLIDAAHAKPGTLTYGSAGNGSSTHLFMELTKYLTKTSIVHVPYKGGAPATAALLGGEVPVMFGNLATVVPQVRANRMRALATTAPARLSALPDVPTMSEAGIAGFRGNTFYGVVAPAHTPKNVIGILNAEMNRILSVESVRRHFQNQSIDLVGGTPEEFATFLRSEVALWNTLLKNVRITAD